LANSFQFQYVLAAGLVAATAVHAADAPATGAAAPIRPMLAVCADPSNLPYSNDRQEGFENRIANLLAADLHADLRYTWFQEHSNFFRRSLFAGACDLVVSVPASLPIVAVTKPYFRSTYVAVTRANDSRHFSSFDDPWLRDARIGLQQVGKDGFTTPPALSLTLRSIDQHIVFFPMWADQSETEPQARIIDAVADGSIDVALVWGPFAGYFARNHPGALRIEPVSTDPRRPEVSFQFDMAIGVRKTDTAFRDRLQGAIDRHPTEIAAILHDYGIPTVAPASTITSPGIPPTASTSRQSVAEQAGSPPPTHKSGG
jgi:quinoprotein dehydrogenase-associated probable ABC transporter substrate-binding protein